MNKLKIYSPNQILLGSFWGGPIATVYFLYKNYSELGNHEYAEKTIYIGSFLTVVLVGTLPFLPENFPNMFLPIMYSLLGKQLAVQSQLSKEDIASDEKYLFESNWKVFGIGTLTLIIFLVVSLVVLFGLDFTHIIDLNE